MSGKIARRLSATFLAVLMTLALGLAASADETEEGDFFEADGTVSTGAQYLGLKGEENSKFGEYRDLEKGFDVILEELRIRGSIGSHFLRLDGRDLGKKDQSLSAEAGRYAKYRVGFLWDQTPHNFSSEARFLGSRASKGYWSVSDVIQNALQGDFPTGGGGDNPQTPPTSAGRANLTNLLENANPVDLRVQRDKGRVDLDYSLFDGFTVRGAYQYEKREGLRAISSGAYNRFKTGAAVGEVFMLYGLEFPEPIQYAGNEFDVGLNYRQDSWYVDLAYHFSSFKNEIGSVMWDNPLRLNGIDDTPGGSALNQLDLFPDSLGHTLSLTGGVTNLPLNSKLTGTVSWGRVTQDDPFLPYTANRALTVDADGTTIAADQPLPAANLDGKVDTILVNAALTSRPIKPLRLDVKANYYGYDNKSSEIAWPIGWARIGESVWSASKYDGLHNRVPEYKRFRTNFEAAYKLCKEATVSADYQYKMVTRNRYRNADNDEHAFGGGVRLKPLSWARVRASYHRERRRIDGMYANNIGEGSGTNKASHEWDQLRMFDQADRDRNLIESYVSVDPLDDLSLGFSFNYDDAEYGKTTPDGKPTYGMKETSGYMMGFDVSYVVSDRATVFAHYSRDDYDTKLLNRAKSDAAGGGSFAVPQNDYSTDIDDTSNTIGGGVNIALIPDKLDLDLTGDYSWATGQFDIANPNFLAGTTTNSAIAYQWPDLKTRTAEIVADLDYSWTQNLSTGVRYIFKRLDLDDFAIDDVVPYGIPTDTQGNDLAYFALMDGNFSGYNAHLVTLMLNYSF